MRKRSSLGQVWASFLPRAGVSGAAPVPSVAACERHQCRKRAPSMPELTVWYMKRLVLAETPKMAWTANFILLFLWGNHGRTAVQDRPLRARANSNPLRKCGSDLQAKGSACATVAAQHRINILILEWNSCWQDHRHLHRYAGAATTRAPFSLLCLAFLLFAPRGLAMVVVASDEASSGRPVGSIYIFFNTALRMSLAWV